jgi:hypothetical protein
MLHEQSASFKITNKIADIIANRVAGGELS